jgi:hypothetical protein
MPPFHFASRLHTKMAARHHLHRSLYLTAGAHHCTPLLLVRAGWHSHWSACCTSTRRWVGRSNECRRHCDHCALPPTASLATHLHLHRSLYLTAGAHHSHSCERVGTATGPPAAPAHDVGWVDQTSVADTATTVHHLPLPHWPLIFICTARSTSLQVHTSPTRASWLAQPLVRLLHQHTVMGGSIKQVSQPR